MGKKVSEMTFAEIAARNKRSAIYNAKIGQKKQITEQLLIEFLEEYSLPKGFTFGKGVRLGQNKTSVKKVLKNYNNGLKILLLTTLV